jgi:hypothetical protein
MRKTPPPKPRDASDFDGAGPMLVFPFMPAPTWYRQYWYEGPPRTVAQLAARLLILMRTACRA